MPHLHYVSLTTGQLQSYSKSFLISGPKLKETLSETCYSWSREKRCRKQVVAQVTLTHKPLTKASHMVKPNVLKESSTCFLCLNNSV